MASTSVGQDSSSAAQENKFGTAASTAVSTGVTAAEGGPDHSESPVRPPVSPITPVVSFAQLSRSQADAKIDPFDLETSNDSDERFIPRPSSLPLDEDDSADATALKAAISVLQLQREKSKRDLESLKLLKSRAAREPEAFAEHLKAGALTHEPTSDVLAATFEGDETDEDEDEQPSATTDSGSLNFPKIPSAQNVVRCPPINWNKYHIVGESLDRMHEDQKRRPTPGEPWNSEQREHFVAAPFSPFRDKLNTLPPPMQTRRSSKKP